MNVAITIGSYRLPEFVKLGVAMSRKVFGDRPILISDDLSSESDAILQFAEDAGCAYLCSPKRRSHFGGDITALIHSTVFAASTNACASLKLSQRMIPIASGFREALERAMENPEVMICLPGQILPQQVARPGAKFYSMLGLLTDCVAIRAGAITGEEIRDHYREAFESASARRDSVVEVAVASLIAKKFPGPACVKLPEWTVHQPFAPKLYLRKSQSLREEYVKAAREVGIECENGFDLREWNQIEKENYLCRPSCV